MAKKISDYIRETLRLKKPQMLFFNSFPNTGNKMLGFPPMLQWLKSFKQEEFLQQIKGNLKRSMCMQEPCPFHHPLSPTGRAPSAASLSNILCFAFPTPPTSIWRHLLGLMKTLRKAHNISLGKHQPPLVTCE